MRAPLQLEVADGDERITLPPGRASVIGRTAGADVLIPHVTVSRRHARFSDETGAWTVEDAGSASGTWVNDEGIGGRVPLRLGDRIRLGQVVLIVRGGAQSALGRRFPLIVRALHGTLHGRGCRTTTMMTRARR